MKGVLVTNRKPFEPVYYGFDCGGGVDCWLELKEWNISNPEYKITLENDLCPMNLLGNVLKYYMFLSEKYSEILVVSLIYLSDELNDEQLPANFVFAGFDCGYLLDDDEPVYFSSLSNELLRDVVNAQLASYKRFLNAQGLFLNLADANSFKIKRDVLITSGEIDYIETAFDDFSIVRVMLYKENPNYNYNV